MPGSSPPQATDRRIVARNALAGWLALFLRAVVALLLFPLLLGRLGLDLFGIWLVFGDLLGHAALVRLGLSAGLLREIAHLEGAAKRRRIVHLLGSVLSIYLLLGTVLTLALVALAPWLVALFDPAPLEMPQMSAALRILALRLLMSFPASIVGAALLGLRRYDLEYLIQSVGNLLRLFLVWNLVRGPGALVTLAWIMVGIDLLEHIMRRLAVLRIAPYLRIRPARPSLRLLRSIGSFSRDAFTLHIAARIQYELDSLVIGLVLGLHLVPIYEAAVKLVTTARQLIDRLTDSIAPTIAAQLGRGGVGPLRSSLVRWSTFLVLFGTPIGLGLLLLGPTFLDLYVGAKLDPHQLHLASMVLSVLALAFFLRLLQVIPGSFLWGMARMKRASRCALLEALANLLLSLALCIPFGLVGVALGTLLPKLVTSLWFFPSWAAQAVGIDAKRLIAVAVAPARAALISSALTLPVLLLVPGALARFLVGGAVLVLSYALVLRAGPHAELMRLRSPAPPSNPE